MIAFIVKSGISMVLLFGLYWLLLRKQKLFLFNRYYLIFSVLISLTIPFISFSPNLGYNKVTSNILTILNKSVDNNAGRNEITVPFDQTILPGNPQSVPLIQTALVKTGSVDSRKILLFIYLSGVFVMLIRFCRNIFHLNKMFRRSVVIDNEWHKIALLEHTFSPYSFLKAIFMNKQDYLENRIAANVLRHELEHVRQLHSLDVIFFEILHILFWFNPVIFLYIRAVRINHEYLADEAVISNLSDMRSYAAELINFTSTPVIIPFTSGFSPSTIRHRLLMINTKTTRSGKNIRMAVTLFVSALLLCILSFRPEYSNNGDQKTKKNSDANKDIVVEEVNFMDNDFNPMKALVIMDGKKLETNEKITIDLKEIKTIHIIKDRKATHKYGRNARYGAVEITTYESDKKSLPDSLYFKPIFTINDKVPEGPITITVSNLYSLSIWTYPVFPYQDLRKRWRTIGIMTRDFYRIRGKVVQKNWEPLPGAQITTTGNTSRVTTNKDGYFQIDDVRLDVIAEISADGYEPVKFKVSDKVFKSELTITLDKKNETDIENTISTNKNITDFSGKWKANVEMSTLPKPKSGRGEFSYKIIQYDSDSLIMYVTIAPENQNVYNGIKRFIFNSVESETDETGAIKSSLLCSIGSDGQSFSVTTRVRSLIGLFKEFKTIETFTLSSDGKQLTISNHYFPDISSGTMGGTEDLVFDKI